MACTFYDDGSLCSIVLGKATVTQHGGSWRYREQCRGDKVRNVPMASLADCLAEAKQRGAVSDVRAVLAQIEAERLAQFEESTVQNDSKAWVRRSSPVVEPPVEPQEAAPEKAKGTKAAKAPAPKKASPKTRAK